MTPPLRRVALLVACLGACSHPKQALLPPTPEVLVHLLPGSAELTVDGALIGRGEQVVPVPDPAHAYVLRASAPGYEAVERAVEGRQLAGSRVVLVLRPRGFGTGRYLDVDAPAALAAASVMLEKRDQHQDALDFAQAAVDAAPDLPAAQRALGDAAYALGLRDRAVNAYNAYLAATPGALDHRYVERRVEELRGDMTLTPARSVR